MLKCTGVFVGLAMLTLAGVARAQEHEWPDLSDPVTIQRILGKAELRDTLEVRGFEGEELFYAKGSETPYTGWAKRMHGNGNGEMLAHAAREGFGEKCLRFVSEKITESLRIEKNGYEMTL